MKKDLVRTGIVLGILLVIYHLVVFMIPFVKTAAFWVSYGFTLAAFAVAAVSIYIAFFQNPNARSKFYGFPIARIGVIYAVAQLIVSLVVMALAQWIPWWIGVLVYAIALGTAATGLVGADAVREEIQRQDKKLKNDVAFMRNLQSRVNQMASRCDVPEVKQFAEDVRYSDPVGGEGLTEIERDLAAVVDELQAAVIDGDSEVIRTLCRKASATLAERNRLCKLNKQ